MVRKPKFGSTNLKKHLAKLAKSAWIEPVVVTRYNMSWGRLVSYSMWLRKIGFSRPIAPEHPLLQLRDHVDYFLYRHPALLNRLAAGQEVDMLLPSCMIRATVLQIVYSIDAPAYLYEQLAFNLLYRRFVGIDAYFPAQHRFIHEMTRLRRDAEVLALLDQVLRDAPLAAIESNAGIAIDRNLPASWLAEIDSPQQK